MKKRERKFIVILRVILAVVLFSVFRKLEFIIPLVNTFVEWGWSLLQIIIASGSFQMISAGIAVLIVFPLCLGLKGQRDYLNKYLKTDMKILLLGLLSFVNFCALASVIASSMGIFKGDLSAVFAHPDIKPDPDIVGWGYFILALVPGIWEELAFRGMIQSKIRQVFSTTTAVFLSSLFFGLFHFSNILTQAPSQVVFGVIMAFFYGIGWGYMTVRTRSLVPAMISHYLVDSVGMIFLNVDNSDPAMVMGFFVILTLMFPVCNIILTKLMYKKGAQSRNLASMPI